jgi:polyferredoxin
MACHGCPGASVRRFCLIWRATLLYLRPGPVPAGLHLPHGLLVISALSLFLFTAVAGRLWCGFACPQTVYTEIFMWIERRLKVTVLARMRLDGSGRSRLEKLVKKWAQALVCGSRWRCGPALPLWGISRPSALWAMGSWPHELRGNVFWVLFYGFATYGNAGFMREQVCKYMCPYARFQSAMFDKDTLIVTYDAKRGESAGPRSRRGPTPRHWDWAIAWIAPCVSRSVLPASTFATACSTNALAAGLRRRVRHRDGQDGQYPRGLFACPPKTVSTPVGRAAPCAASPACFGLAS